MATTRNVIKTLLMLLLVVTAFGAGWLAGMTRMGAGVDPVDLPAIERAFAEKMNGAALVGRFTVAGREDRAATADRYDLYSVEKVGDDLWRFNAKIGEVGVTVPVVVRMRFVDDTPIILMTDASVPGMDVRFSARVLFYDDLYAGTWGDGRRSGLMFGRIERGGAVR